MKIGIDCRLWNETGVGRYIRNLVLNLQNIDKKNEYVLFVLSKDEEDIRKNWKLEIGNWKLRPADVRWHTIAEQFEFPKILNRENLDLMHFPYFSVPLFYNKPFVVTIHDLIINHFSTGNASTLSLPAYKLKLLGYKIVMYMAAKKAKKIIAVSNATKGEIVDHLKINPQKIAVTYEGVDSLIQNSKIKVQNYSSEFKIKSYFLYVGNAFPHKNLDRLIKAFSFLNSLSPLNLILVGKDDYFYKRLKRKVEQLNLSEKVIFLQNVSDEELVDLYRNAKALILPSLMEGFGLPALEAMANKCLVLASDIPALKEICGDAAIYFDPLNVDELASKLGMITSHTAEYEMLGEIRKKGIERMKLFSWQKMAKETLKIYENCVGL